MSTTAIPNPSSRRLELLIEHVSAALRQVECKKYPKGEIWQRVRHSVEFNLELEMLGGFDIDFVSNAEPLSGISSYLSDRLSNRITVQVPFKVERIGACRFIARDL